MICALSKYIVKFYSHLICHAILHNNNWIKDRLYLDCLVQKLFSKVHKHSSGIQVLLSLRKVFLNSIRGLILKTNINVQVPIYNLPNISRWRTKPFELLRLSVYAVGVEYVNYIWTWFHKSLLSIRSSFEIITWYSFSPFFSLSLVF